MAVHAPQVVVGTHEHSNSGSKIGCSLSLPYKVNNLQYCIQQAQHFWSMSVHAQVVIGRRPMNIYGSNSVFFPPIYPTEVLKLWYISNEVTIIQSCYSCQATARTGPGKFLTSDLTSYPGGPIICIYMSMKSTNVKSEFFRMPFLISSFVTTKKLRLLHRQEGRKS
jgi:hypothetical protein